MTIRAKKEYLNNKDFYYEIIVSKAKGKLSYKAEKMIALLGQNAIKRKSRSFPNEDDKWDCMQSGLLDMYANWFKFDETKSTNAFAYFTEVFKRGMAKGWNELFKKKGNNDIKLISIESSNDGMGMPNF